MAKKPTYEELEQRVKELEQAESERKHAEDELQKREITIQSVFDATPVGICIMESRVYKRANRYWCEHFGYSEEDLIGRTTEFLYESHEEYECVGRELYKNLLKKEIAFSRARLKRSDGEFRDVNLIAKPLNPYDLEAGIVVVVHDITDYKKATEALRESEERLRIAGKAAYDLIYEWNVPNDALEWFGDIDGLLGYEPGAISRDIGAWLDLIHPEDRGQLENAVELHRAATDPIHYEYRIKHRDGTYRYLQDHGLPMLDNQGRPYKWIGVCADISERKQAEGALRESESYFSQMFEQSTTSTCLYNPDGTIKRVNHEFSKMFGVEEKVIINAGYNVFKDQATIDAGVMPLLREIFDEKKTKNWETIFDIDVASASTGTPTLRAGKIFLEVFGYPVLNRKGNLEYVVLQHYDITERKQSQVELKESEDKFRNFAEQSLVGIYLISDGAFKYVNPKFAEMFGYRVDECLNNMHFPQLVHPEDLATVKKQVGRRLSEETKAVRYSFRGIKKSGDTIHVEIFGSSMVLKGKTVATGTMLDISDRIDAEKALKESESRLKKAQSVAKIGSWEYDISAGKIWGSEQAFRIYGIERTSPYLPLDRVEACILEAPRVNQALIDLIQENKSYDIEFEIRQEVGEQTIFIHSIAELVYENGLPIKVLGVIQDVTEQKKAEKERKNLEHQLHRAQKMEALGLLAGGVAHDLNNILSGIVTYPELLLMDLPEDSPLTRPIKTIQESGMRAVDVVADLLTIARGVATGREALNLNTIVTEYLGSPECHELERTHSFVNFKTELSSDLLNMNGSPTHIKKALMNLITNASEAIEGSGTVTISSNNRYLDELLKGYEDVRHGEYVVLSISDEGSGISPEDIERIFEPFYTKKVMGRSGTGLGLAVVWNTVQDHKGYINVKSSERGTVFELYFPVTREKIAAEEEEVPLEDYLGHGEKILVVDDEERQREIAGVLLTKLGYVPEAVESGEEAIEYLKKHPMDLIVLDMVMPKGINGRKTYQEIIKIRPGQKAVIASGYAKTKEVDIAQELGAGKYIKKPYTLEKIGVAVKKELNFESENG